MTLKEYRKHRLSRMNWFRRFLVHINLFKIVVKDIDVWKNNNDYSSKIMVNIYNPLTYVMLLIYIPLALVINGFNPSSYRDLKKELKEQFKRK